MDSRTRAKEEKNQNIEEKGTKHPTEEHRPDEKPIDEWVECPERRVLDGTWKLPNYGVWVHPSNSPR